MVLVPGEVRSVTLTVPAATAAETFAVAVVATEGALSHSATLALTAHPPQSVRTYQDGSALYIESSSGTDTARIGLATSWGGSIVELSLNGTNFINAHDTGREVQPAFREGDDLNWNPTLGGDTYDQGTPTQAYTLMADGLYTRAQSLQWSPDFFGGGAGHPVAGDMLVEQTVTAVLSQLHTFKVHYKATHLGNDLHPNYIQELPAVYSNQNYNHFIYYGGADPWTNGSVTATLFPNLPQFSPMLYVPEHWGAYADDKNLGVTLYAPSRYPYTFGFASADPGPGGPTDNATNDFQLLDYLTIWPRMVFETDVYLIAGDVEEARQTIYQLHQILGAPDIFPPTGQIDSLAPGSAIRGITTVAGWAFDDTEVSKIEITVDGVVDGIATYGSPRPDIPAGFAHAPENCGFSYDLDTSKYVNGPHTLNARVFDTSGNVALFPTVGITLSN
jgi:hypothetical protein